MGGASVMSRSGHQKNLAMPKMKHKTPKLLITPFSPGPSYFRPCRSTHSPQYSVLQHPQFSPKHVTKFQVHSKQMHKLIVLNILILNSLNRALEGKRL